MEILGIQESGIGAVSQANRKRLSDSGAKDTYAQLLQNKLDSLKDDLEEMEQRREELEELEKTHAELTGKSDGQHTALESTETVKRFLPDGTILVTTSKDGEIVEQYKKKPHLVPVPDESAPKPEEGSGVSEKVKWIPHYNIMELLSMK